MSIQKKNTSALIRDLAADLDRPSEARNWTLRFWSTFGIGFLLFGLATIWIAESWPTLAYLPTNLADTDFWIETILWVCAAFSCAWVAFQSSYPGNSPKRAMILAGVFLLSVLSWTLMRWSPASLAVETWGEMDLDRGRCGIFTLLSGGFFAAGMFKVLRRAAPTRLGMTGAWSAAAAGSVGSLYMHLICRHENSLHVLIWHILPVWVLAAIGARLGRQRLNW